MRALTSALAVVLVLGGAAACSDGSDDAREPGGRADAPGADGAPPRDGSTTTTSSRGRERAVPPDPLDGELAAALVAAGPPGWQLDPEPPATGPLDLRAAARAEPDRQAERAVLETRGFRRGAVRTWRGERGEVAVATAYQFLDAAGASAYLVDGTTALEGFAAAGFPVPEIPGAVGFSGAAGGAEAQRAVHGVAFTRGPRFFLLLVSGEGSDVDVDDARALAVAQQDRATAPPA